MVEPFSFQFNFQTGDDNFFQRRQEAHLISQQANTEWNNLYQALVAAGVVVHRFADHSSVTPDALYPNNWFSTHPGGILCLYPMKAPNRRLERRPDIIDFLRQRYPTVLDLSGHEARNRFLEGTGSIVIDHDSQTAFAVRSGRTDEELFSQWAKMLGYRPVVFSAEDGMGRPVYHTNVCLSLNRRVSFWVPDAIRDPGQRSQLEKHLAGRHVVTLTLDQMDLFCANTLVLQDQGGNAVLVCSSTAWEGYTSSQQKEIQDVCIPVHVPLETIEAYGGGGARCMLAELW